MLVYIMIFHVNVHMCTYYFTLTLLHDIVCIIIQKCRVSKFSEPLAAHYFTQASLAIIYLHERGVYHRDIKPENCVLDEHFNLKLTDFGTNKVCNWFVCVLS